MFARGAIECAHSTSSETSSAQRLCASWPVPLLVGGGGVAGGLPWILKVSKVGMPGLHATPVSPHMCGRPNCVLKLFRSLRMVALPNESTITIVWPWPFRPFVYSGPRLYDVCIDTGLKQRRPRAKHCAAVGGVVAVESSSKALSSGWSVPARLAGPLTVGP